jgi:hypothetical protein
VRERRHSPQRRKITWRTIFYSFLHTRRSKVRRAGEESGVFIDYHEPHLRWTIVLIMMLSTLDAALTLRLLSAGAQEVNPVMAFLLESYNTQTFIAAKMAGTGLGLGVLVALENFRLRWGLQVRQTLYFFLAAYLALVVYEIYLIRLAL